MSNFQECMDTWGIFKDFISKGLIMGIKVTSRTTGEGPRVNLKQPIILQLTSSQAAGL
ncbi:hypothetical protein DPMN_153995 [Dreissena polymorpha]|uniref:Uncharacterized protein n=1 Tax=Dreissena polymorpha TaxID=45954 RepID=A0A9D4J9X6_DREPO|nr:hypothetical protein DPMN_153995 [Dreissena polymorpha]